MNPLKLVIFDLDDTLCDTSGQIQSASQSLGHVQLFAGVPELLADLRAKGLHTAIVSTGDPLVQEEKIAFLGLRALVDAVLICAQPEEKLTLFQRCLRDFGARPEETLVVGDRIDREISFGKQLGCVTAWALQGRHSRRLPSGEGERADFVLHNISELRERLTH
jgi:FMN phosphatase YigB (HAD superfamily)